MFLLHNDQRFECFANTHQKKNFLKLFNATLINVFVKGRVDGIVDREGLHSQQPPRGETRVIVIISYIITNRITIRDTIINYITNNTSWLAAIAIVVSVIGWVDSILGCSISQMAQETIWLFPRSVFQNLKYNVLFSVVIGILSRQWPQFYLIEYQLQFCLNKYDALSIRFKWTSNYNRRVAML